MPASNPDKPLGALFVAAARDREALAELVAAVVGNAKAKSLGQLASWFGVSVNTIKTGWRRSGDMPGREGAWPLAEILLWKLRRDVAPAETEEAQTRRSSLDRKREADARKAEADASAKELKNSVAAGQLLHRADVEREMSEHIAVVRHTLTRIPAQLLPQLPKKLAHSTSEIVRQEIERALNLLADLSIETIE